MKIFCFGNEFIQEDGLAKELINELDVQNVEFVSCTQVEELLDQQGRLLIMDVVKGIDEVTVIEDINDLQSKNIMSLHDFDLGFFLKLLNAIDTVSEVVIIGLPMKGRKNKIKQSVKEIIEKLNAT